MRLICVLCLLIPLNVLTLRLDQIKGPRIINPPAAIFQAQATSSGELDPCQYMLQNLTSIENLRSHEFAALEQCLYYFLAGESAKRMKRLGIPHPIASVPPNYLSRQPVNIKFNQITLQHFELNEFLKDVAIHGYMELSWMDDRLQWSRDTWKMEKLQIQSVNHVWIPLFIAQNYDTHLKNGDAFEMRRLEVTSAGNVSAVLAFALRTFCDDSDFENYPDDVYKCCFTLEPQSNPDIIEFAVSGLPIFTDPKYFRDYGWKVSGTVPQTVEDPAQVAQLGFCLNLQRASSSVRIELTVPTMVCALLFLLTPFLGVIKIQIYTKFGILVLQFLTFILFSNRISPHLGSAAATPKLLRFLEFTVSLNGLSLAVSIFLWACTRIKRDLPPWGQLNQISTFVNRFLCVMQTHTSVEDENIEKAPQSGSYQQDWMAAFVALHAIIMTVIIIIFVFGYLFLF
ncbi:hypothetical protein DICVIV_05107 [Dictyocaulus viviparus]|uniref:Neurotransmitter-gated ion-channel ligand-binding domain-containing protein n=1 Tax=Dictyocaulus viviparus TaxID=29172 RepID=A0A0D8XY89_DICVI|nr:hypothetical protein DICVIV_05107 [Dictyocaulus viviparus]